MSIEIDEEQQRLVTEACEYMCSNKVCPRADVRILAHVRLLTFYARAWDMEESELVMAVRSYFLSYTPEDIVAAKQCLVDPDETILN